MSGNLRISYCFHYQTDHEIRFDMDFDSQSMQLQGMPENLPAWTELGFRQCSHCPLKPGQQPHCPAAAQLHQIVERFKDTQSFENTTVAVLTRDRNYWKESSMQDGMHGIFGLVMATSGCPHMDFLKPMARYHLPFSNYDDTLIRSVSMYVLQTIAHTRNTRNLCIDFTELEDNYHRVNQLNTDFISRIRVAKQAGDVGENAIVILDSFVKLIEMEFSTDFSLLKEILLQEEAD